METLKLCVITPEGIFYESRADMVIIRTTEGNIGVLPGHIPLMALVSHGRFTVLEGGMRREGLLTDGFAEVLPKSVTLIVKEAQWGKAAI